MLADGVVVVATSGVVAGVSTGDDSGSAMTVSSTEGFVSSCASETYPLSDTESVGIMVSSILSIS